MKKNNFYKKFKKLTGYSFLDIGLKFDLSKQFVHSSFGNYSTTYKNSNKFMMITMIDLKIEDYKNNINELEEFKNEIKNY